MKRSKQRKFRRQEFVMILFPDNPWKSLMECCEYPPEKPLFDGEIGSLDTGTVFLKPHSAQPK